MPATVADAGEASGELLHLAEHGIRPGVAGDEDRHSAKPEQATGAIDKRGFNVSAADVESEHGAPGPSGDATGMWVQK
ncbi:hypothetical protein [Cryobacterium sp. PH31-O1]|uniref:hypothetical protein n=1 Tax=Cryobacterium sp. PH31-O1 TaxID=3046306 RepID=UPI0024BAE221|nr:hypothetical protein [Cryobacterium sp. PH31-O1]MDJ0338196.1 hypothetical protein [Cryobacterium sp. PH31-O1]